MANEFKVKNGIIISGSADIEQNLTVRGTLTADQYNVSIVSTSILYESGSTKFGNTLDDLHEFTGSVAITGSITLNGNPIGTGKLDEATFNSFTSSYTTGAFTGSFIGDGSQLTNIPSSGVTGLNLNKIISGSVSASISPDKGLEINTNTIISGALNVSGAITLNGEPIGTGKLDETTFNTFTSSYTTVSGSIDNRLDVLEAYSGSQQVPTASFAFRTQRTDVYCKNVSGTQIDKGTVVRITGSVGDNPLIGVASLLTEGQSANTLGIAAENIPNDSFGLVITEGVLIGVNTSGMTAGQLIFLGENGTFTTSYPVSPNHGVRLGEVLRVQQNQGSIYVRVDNGAELGESHDVYDTTTNSSYGDLLVKSGSVWVNSRSLNGNYAVTGSLTITQNLTVLGSSSLVYVTSSNLAVSASFISVNVFEPAERFGGIKVYDSGSSNATASLAWDSLHNHWVYQNVSGSSYSGGMLLSGPRNSGSLGDEPNLINGRIVKSVGGDHIDVSIISETGTTITVAGDLVANSITGAFDFLGLVNRPTLVSGSSQIVYSGLTGIPSDIVSSSSQISAFGFLETSSFNTYTSSNDGRVSSLESKTGSYATTGSNSFVGNENINGNLSVTGSVVISGSIDITNANVGNSRFLFTQASGATTWSIAHNLGYNYPNVTIYDGSNNKVMLPADVISVDANTTQVTFATPEYGYALVSMGGLSTTTSDAIIYSLQTTTSSLNTFTSSAITRLNSIEGVSGSYATTGSNLLKGTQTISGSVIPAVTNTYDLGSETNQFRHLYLSSASLYIDGTKVLGSTTQELQITTDTGQAFKILEDGSDNITLQSADGNIELKSSGGGDVILDPTTGVIALKGTTTLYAGNKLLSSDGNAIQIGNSTTITGSLVVTGFIETQELRTTYISSSILYRSGSTKFGDELSDTHSFTGSLLVSGSISVPGSGLISGSAQVDIMSTTNIARLATTGSNTFTSNQIVSGSVTSTSTITGTNFVTNGTTLYGVTLKGRAADNYGAIGYYSSDGATRYGYIQSHSSNGGQLNITSDGGGQVIMDNRGVVVTSALSGSAAIFSSNVGTTALNMNNMASLGSIGGGSIYLPHTAVIMFRTTDGATARGKITADNSNNLLLNSDNGGYVSIGNSAPSFPLEVTTNTSSATTTVASFHNLDYTSGTKTFIRVRTQTNVGSSFSSFFGTGQDGTLHIVANDFARGGDIKINPFTGNITTSGTINGLSLPNDLFAQQFLLMGS
jgi:hypothetical protein